MKVSLVATLFLLLVLSCTAATVPTKLGSSSTQSPLPSRTVRGRALISTQLPPVLIEFSKPFKYVGSQAFILYEVAEAEQYFFVEAEKDGAIKRMYWVQFEGYLPNNTHSYDYKSTKTVNIGGLDFFADAYARNIKASPGRPDSDGNRARDFLASKGYRLASDEVLSQRLVYMADEAKRNELMIIYLEDLTTMKLTADDLAKGGKAADQWETISKGLLERATKNMKISR